MGGRFNEILDEVTRSLERGIRVGEGDGIDIAI